MCEVEPSNEITDQMLDTLLMRVLTPKWFNLACAAFCLRFRNSFASVTAMPLGEHPLPYAPLAERLSKYNSNSFFVIPFPRKKTNRRHTRQQTLASATNTATTPKKTKVVVARTMPSLLPLIVESAV